MCVALCLIFHLKSKNRLSYLDELPIRGGGGGDTRDFYYHILTVRRCFKNFFRAASPKLDACYNQWHFIIGNFSFF